MVSLRGSGPRHKKTELSRGGVGSTGGLAVENVREPRTWHYQLIKDKQMTKMVGLGLYIEDGCNLGD